MATFAHAKGSSHHSTSPCVVGLGCDCVKHAKVQRQLIKGMAILMHFVIEEWTQHFGEAKYERLENGNTSKLIKNATPHHVTP